MTEAEGDADTARVTRVLEEISRAHAQVRAERRAHRPLAARLRRLERLHAEHAAELGGLVSIDAATVRPQAQQDRVVAALSSAEAELGRRLVRESVAADSGALALLLAAMAAGIAQETAQL